MTQKTALDFIRNMVWWLFDFSAICNVFSYTNLIHALAGGVGSAFAITVFYPLETARTRLQVEQSRECTYSYEIVQRVFHEEGLIGLYRGWLSLVISLFMTNFVYFYVFHGLKDILCLEGLDQFVATDLVFGVIAGSVSVLVTNPLWVINTRLKLQNTKINEEKLKNPKYSGIVDCLFHIVKHERLSSLWSGTMSSLMLVSNPAIQFMVYELLKRNLQLLYQEENLGDPCYFACGAMGKIAATVVTYPLQIVQTRLRAGYGRSSDKQKQTTLIWILRTEGIRGLYRGIEAKLSQTVLTAALMFMLYEKISRFVFNVFGVDK